METQQFKYARRVVIFKRRGYLFILASSLIAMTVDLIAKMADQRLTLIEKFLFPASYLVIGAGMVSLWRGRWVKQIEIFIFVGAAGAALTKLYDTLFLQSGEYQWQELVNLLFWLPVVYMLAFTLFDGLRSSVLASAGFMAAGAGLVFFASLNESARRVSAEIMLPMRFFIISAAYILILSWNVRIKDVYRKVVRRTETLEKMAHTDTLTDIPNRRAFVKVMETEMMRAANFNSPLSLALFDLDNLKSINDTLGHLSGDQALLELAHFVRSQLRREDYLFRFGGDEFILVFSDTELQDAVEIANRLRQKVESQPFEHGIDLTISFGVTRFHPGENLNEVLRRSDQALYAAKSKGKNQVVCMA